MGSLAGYTGIVIHHKTGFQAIMPLCLMARQEKTQHLMCKCSGGSFVPVSGQAQKHQ
jgi:hypothetical protein